MTHIFCSSSVVMPFDCLVSRCRRHIKNSAFLCIQGVFYPLVDSATRQHLGITGPLLYVCVFGSIVGSFLFKLGFKWSSLCFVCLF